MIPPNGSSNSDLHRHGVGGARREAQSATPHGTVAALPPSRHLQGYFDTTLDGSAQWLMSFGLDLKTIRAGLKLDQGGQP